MSLNACIHCLAPRSESDEVDHRPDCPEATGFIPVTGDDIADLLVCEDCHEPFRVGEVYVRRPETPFEEYRALPMFEIVCVGCAFLPRKAAS